MHTQYNIIIYIVNNFLNYTVYYLDQNNITIHYLNFQINILQYLNQSTEHYNLSKSPILYKLLIHRVYQINNFLILFYKY